MRTVCDTPRPFPCAMNCSTTSTKCGCFGLETTNNSDERSLRHAEIWRKLSFGTQSESGSRFVETLLTVIEDLPPTTSPPIDFLTAAVEALTANKSAPKINRRDVNDYTSG